MFTQAKTVIAGLDPAIHVSAVGSGAESDMDHRVKPGDDDARRQS
jgi:hypothetical protein